MKSTLPRSSNQGFSLTELLVVIGIIAILGGLLAFLLTHGGQKKPRTPPMQCLLNLKEIGLAFKIWEADNGDKYPMAVSTSQGGTMEFNTGADTFRHFQVMSNELATPKILICPADTRNAAADFVHLENKNVSYFVSLDANDAYPRMFLSGDRNITGPQKPENGILKLTSADAIRWTAEMHGNRGNVVFSDGSAVMLSNSALGEASKNAGGATNFWRIALPE